MSRKELNMTESLELSVLTFFRLQIPWLCDRSDGSTISRMSWKASA